MLFAKRLKKLRTEYHYTQSELADKIGINRATIAGYETEKKQPNFEILLKIAKVFNVSTDFLLGLQDETNQEKFEKTYYDRVIEIFDKPLDISMDNAVFNTFDKMIVKEKNPETKRLYVKCSPFGVLCEIYFKATELGLDIGFSETLNEILQYAFCDFLTIYEKCLIDIENIEQSTIEDKAKNIANKFKADALYEIPDLVNTAIKGFINYSYDQLMDKINK